MMPVIPHLTNECLSVLEKNKKVAWPLVKSEFLHKEKKEIVIQINGKKRNTILVEKNTDEKIILQKIDEKKLVTKYIENNKIFKTIYIKDKLINIIIK